MPIIQIENLSHHYGERVALNEVSFHVDHREIFGLLGPNGGGKTTLFRILSTLIPVSKGKVLLFGQDLRLNVQNVRKEIGVVFQSPSLDKKLTVKENLCHQGHLYGLSGKPLRICINEMLERVKLKDRSEDLVEKLSGGLQRRVELAKALLHHPKLLLLDEPSTGLDPGARRDLWDYLRELRDQDGTTIVLTTHLMEEAEHCDRLGILDQGNLIALDKPEVLRARLGGEMIIARTKNPKKLCEEIHSKFGNNPQILDDTVRFEQTHAHTFIARLVEAFPGQIDAITVGKPTLEDVFIQQTGHRFWNENQNGPARNGSKLEMITTPTAQGKQEG